MPPPPPGCTISCHTNWESGVCKGPLKLITHCIGRPQLQLGKELNAHRSSSYDMSSTRKGYTRNILNCNRAALLLHSCRAFLVQVQGFNLDQQQQQQRGVCCCSNVEQCNLQSGCHLSHFCMICFIKLSFFGAKYKTPQITNADLSYVLC